MPFYVCRNCSFGDDLPYRRCPRCSSALFVPTIPSALPPKRTQRPSPGVYRDPAAMGRWLEGIQPGPPGRFRDPPPPANLWLSPGAIRYRWWRLVWVGAISVGCQPCSWAVVDIYPPVWYNRRNTSVALSTLSVKLSRFSVREISTSEFQLLPPLWLKLETKPMAYPPFWVRILVILVATSVNQKDHATPLMRQKKSTSKRPLNIPQPHKCKAPVVHRYCAQ